MALSDLNLTHPSCQQSPTTPSLQLIWHVTNPGEEANIYCISYMAFFAEWCTWCDPAWRCGKNWVAHQNEDDHLANIRAGDESQVESSKKESITDQMNFSKQTCLEKVKALFGGTISSILNMSTTGCNATLATSDNILRRVQQCPKFLLWLLSKLRLWIWQK